MEFIVLCTVGLVLAILAIKRKEVIKWMEKLRLEREWRNVEELAMRKGLELVLRSDKQYFQRRRPMPRGGVLYIHGDGLFVRHEVVKPETVIKFLGKICGCS